MVPHSQEAGSLALTLPHPCFPHSIGPSVQGSPYRPSIPRISWDTLYYPIREYSVFEVGKKYSEALISISFFIRMSVFDLEDRVRGFLQPSVYLQRATNRSRARALKNTWRGQLRALLFQIQHFKGELHGFCPLLFNFYPLGVTRVSAGQRSKTGARLKCPLECPRICFT